MATRNGKIANLPNDIREQLNFRLSEGETGRELAAWLNALPEVRSVLGLQFNGSNISEVNLTHWRQGGYLQWLTERECFDSARALAEGDCSLETTGLTAERLLNILTVRFGELLMRWDFSPDEGVSETAAFSAVAKKARILQAISRSVLAIHRIQSRSACSKADPARSSLDTPAGYSVPGAPAPKFAFPSHPPIDANGEPFRQTEGPEPVEGPSQGPEPVEGIPAAGKNPAAPEARPGAAPLRPLRASRGRSGASPEILSGPLSPSSITLNLSQTPFRADSALAEVLSAV
jgi:hypothetical protein